VYNCNSSKLKQTDDMIMTNCKQLLQNKKNVKIQTTQLIYSTKSIEDVWIKKKMPYEKLKIC
jgi:hypothetical protein